MSLSGWEHLTNLPIANGICYLITSVIIKHQLLVGENHDESTGCINDFMWDKSIVDLGMRAAYICDRCRDVTDKNILSAKEFAHFSSVLDIISNQSRRGVDILDDVVKLAAPEPIEKTFDVFLCHNSKDKPAVRVLDTRLKAAGIKTWFDEESLMPGTIWQDELEKQIGSIRVCAVIVGPNGEGPWQEIERRTFINEFANRSCPIIPVLIDGAPTAPVLPLFLRNFMWCDIRNGDERQFDRLVASIRSRVTPSGR